MNRIIKVAVVGGMGQMASPMALHWKNKETIQVLKIHDRKTPNVDRSLARKNWLDYGAQLVSSFEELVNNKDLDGVFICCGKNGDDIGIISQLTKLLSVRKNVFICHLSTVSTDFAKEAASYCKKHGVTYANYPLTGGVIGAKEGKLLILASGDKELYEKLSPSLQFLGTPKYFGEQVDSGAQVKFISHLMVFNGLVGICSAAALHAECFTEGTLGTSSQLEFFDFLNTGAGGTRQWDVALSFGLKKNIWDAPFLLKHAAPDALYVVDLCIKKQLSFLVIESILNTAFCFSYILNNLGIQHATQAIVRELVKQKAKDLDDFIRKHSGNREDLKGNLQKCVLSLPEEIRRSVLLDVNEKQFETF